MTAKTRRLLTFLAKLLITASIFFWIFNGIELPLLRERASQLTLSAAFMCIAAMLVQSVVAAARLRLLTAHLGTGVSFSVSWKFTMIGLFFNQTLPSAIGGDAMKVWLLARRDAWSMRASVHCILIDRALGLLALLLVICLTVPWIFATIHDSQATTAISLIVAIGIAGTLIFLLMPQLPPRIERTRLVSELRQLRDALRSVFGNASVCSFAGMYGVSMYILNTALVWYVATDVDIDVGFVECLVVVPLAFLISFVPVSIAGWGLREGAMITGFAYVGMPAADALFLSVTLGISMTLVGLLGGIVWLVTRAGTPPAEIKKAETG